MPFRANDAAHLTKERAKSYLLSRELSEDQRQIAGVWLEEIFLELGPAVDNYPMWHPLISNHSSEYPVTLPGPECGYSGLDHTVHFSNGFITCPYSDGSDVMESVGKIKYDPIAYVSSERLDVSLYHPNATPILIKFQWGRQLLDDETIPLSIALALLLEKEVPTWRWSQVAEPWEDMRPYILGSPHGSRSSLFVNQATGQGLKKVWNSLIEAGIFGPIRK